jgi:glycosyltransferase involved in cell wall biosynthesis
MGVVLEGRVKLRLVVPADVDAPTGGNVYDLAVAEALNRGGDEVDVVRCEQAELATVLGHGWDGPTLVDGLLACREPAALASTRPAVLVHMPLAWETGLSIDRAIELERCERHALQHASVVIATSQWTAGHLARHHGRDDIAVATPGVDPAPISAGSTPPLFVHLAAVVPHKNQLSVVTALMRLHDLPWRARLAGPLDRHPAYAAAVQEAVVAAGLADRVEIPGAMDRDQAWAGADLALLPSRVESYGMVVTEALARGIPAVVSEGGPAEALGMTTKGHPGVVISAGDTDALAHVLGRWLTSEQYRADLRTSALARRGTLEGWDTTARRIKLALTGTP